MLTRINNRVEWGMRLNVRLAAVWFFAAISGGAIGGFSIHALVFWLNGEFELTTAEWSGIVSAFSTFVAVCVALWTLTTDARNRSAERRKSQGVYRWLIMGESDQAYRYLSELQSILDKFIDFENESKFTPEDGLRALEIGDDLYVHNLDKHINALIYFQNDSAESLAMLAADLPRIRAEIRTVFDSDNPRDYKGKVAIKAADRIDLLLHTATTLNWEIRPARS